DRLDEVVDVRLQRREMAARAGGDPAAQRRVLERLRVVAEGLPVGLELLLEAGTRGPGLDAGRPRARINVEHAVEPAQVDRYGGRPGHARPPAPDPPGG